MFWFTHISSIKFSFVITHLALIVFCSVYLNSACFYFSTLCKFTVFIPFPTFYIHFKLYAPSASESALVSFFFLVLLCFCFSLLRCFHLNLFYFRIRYLLDRCQIEVKLHADLKLVYVSVSVALRHSHHNTVSATLMPLQWPPAVHGQIYRLSSK